jgi:hypothetical protein
MKGEEVKKAKGKNKREGVPEPPAVVGEFL